MYKFTLIIFFLLALYLLFAIYPILRAQKISPALVKAAIPYSQHPENAKMTILVAGDSLAVGVGADDNSYSIAGLLGAYFPRADLINLGVSGATLKDLQEVLQTQKTHYDLVFLTIGANDITHRTPYTDIKIELFEILKLASSIGSKIMILNCGNLGQAPLFRWPISTFMTYRAAKVRSIFIDEIAKFNNATYVNLWNEKNDEIFASDYEKYYAHDAFHLSEAGYKIWFEIIKRSLDLSVQK